MKYTAKGDWPRPFLDRYRLDHPEAEQKENESVGLLNGEWNVRLAFSITPQLLCRPEKSGKNIIVESTIVLTAIIISRKPTLLDCE